MRKVFNLNLFFLFIIGFIFFSLFFVLVLGSKSAIAIKKIKGEIQEVEIKYKKYGYWVSYRYNEKEGWQYHGQYNPGWSKVEKMNDSQFSKLWYPESHKALASKLEFVSENRQEGLEILLGEVKNNTYDANFIVGGAGLTDTINQEEIRKNKDFYKIINYQLVLDTEYKPPATPEDEGGIAEETADESTKKETDTTTPSDKTIAKIEAPSLSNITRFSSLSDFLNFLPTIIAALAGMAFLIALVIGGYQYMTSAGNEEQAQKAKNTLIWAVIGIIVVALASAAVSWFKKRAQSPETTIPQETTPSQPTEGTSPPETTTPEEETSPSESSPGEIEEVPNWPSPDREPL